MLRPQRERHTSRLHSRFFERQGATVASDLYVYMRTCKVSSSICRSFKRNVRLIKAHCVSASLTRSARVGRSNLLSNSRGVRLTKQMRGIPARKQWGPGSMVRRGRGDPPLAGGGGGGGGGSDDDDEDLHRKRTTPHRRRACCSLALVARASVLRGPIGAPRDREESSSRS
jgi:hypothetical protein